MLTQKNLCQYTKIQYPQLNFNRLFDLFIQQGSNAPISGIDQNSSNLWQYFQKGKVICIIYIVYNRIVFWFNFKNTLTTFLTRHQSWGEIPYGNWSRNLWNCIWCQQLCHQECQLFYPKWRNSSVKYFDSNPSYVQI